MIHKCLDMAIANLMYHCKYINKFVLLLRKSAVVSKMCSILNDSHRYLNTEMMSGYTNSHLRLIRIFA